MDDAHDDEHPHRVAQIVQLAAAIAQLGDPVLAAGDFNMREGRPEYAVFTGLTGMRDAAVELDRRQPTTLVSNPYRHQRGADTTRSASTTSSRATATARRLRVRSLERIFDEPPAGGARGLLGPRGSDRRDRARAATPRAARRSPKRRPRSSPRASSRRDARPREARRGEQRLAAAGALAGAALAVAGSRQPWLSRRRVLRAGLGAGALLALPFGLTNAALSELAVPDEVRAFDVVAAQLAALQSRGVAAAAR